MGSWDPNFVGILAFWAFGIFSFLVFGILGFWDTLILGFRGPKFLGFLDFSFLRLCDVVCMGHGTYSGTQSLHNTLLIA